jgi:hypothetical protein
MRLTVDSLAAILKRQTDRQLHPIRFNFNSIFTGQYSQCAYDNFLRFLAISCNGGTSSDGER